MLPAIFPQNFTRARFFQILCALAIFVLSPAASLAQILNAQEQDIANRMISDPNQKRALLRLDPTLAAVARARATDMATRDYFDHVNPDGVAANYLVRQAGYALPASWGTNPTDNFIESIAAGQQPGQTPAETAWQGWMASTSHRNHILAIDPFYVDQTSYGVGYAYNANSTYKYYFVIITAPPAPGSTPPPAAVNGAIFVSQNVPGTMTAGQTYRVTIEMRNTGTTTWNEANQIRLGSQAPAGNLTWGLSRVQMPRDVAPGASIALGFDVTAPAGAGVQLFQWQMTAGNAGAFGEPSPQIPVNAVVDLTSTPFPPPVNVPPPAPAPVASPAPAASSGSSSSSSSSKKKKKKKKKKK